MEKYKIIIIINIPVDIVVICFTLQFKLIFQAKMPARPLRIPLSDLIILINCGSEHLTSLCLVSVTVAQTSQQK